MTQRTKCTCQLIVGITGSVMGVAAWATAGHMALLGNWLPASITMCAAAWMMSVAETAFDRMLADAWGARVQTRQLRHRDK